ncbi:hypothetical protein D932_03210 [Enterococcus casseliflavus 14-MB-W-14]|nr:hypothetical protein D932_03210 [Enterococcus casseliflavus 14-MB-W-14]
MRGICFFIEKLFLFYNDGKRWFIRNTFISDYQNSIGHKDGVLSFYPKNG